MALQVPIPGFSQRVGHIPDGSVVYVSGVEDPAKRSLVMALSGLVEGTIYVTTGWVEELKRSLASSGIVGVEVKDYREVSELASLVDVGGLLIVDSFSFIHIDSDIVAIAAELEGLRNASRSLGGYVILVSDDGMIDERTSSIIAHVSDCVIRFCARETNDGVVSYLRINKWLGGSASRGNIYYDYQDGEISLDLRARVV
jgi:KaiC/GvpD/RAD55 family RecA-like ATPase